MPMYNSTEYSDTYSQASERLWQFYKDELVLNNNNNAIDCPNDNNNSISLKFEQKKQSKQKTITQMMLK